MSYYEADKYATCILVGMLAGPGGPKYISPSNQAETVKTAWDMADLMIIENEKRRALYQEREKEREAEE